MTTRSEIRRRREARAARIAVLEQCYRAGDTRAGAAGKAGVSTQTAYRWFRDFRDRGIERAPGAPRLAKWTRYDLRPARYTGPVWIGKRIAPPVDTDSRM